MRFGTQKMNTNNVQNDQNAQGVKKDDLGA